MALASALLVLLVETGLFAQPVTAREASVRVDIAAGPLSTSLARFSEITGISVGYAGDLPRILTKRVTGTMTPEAVLRKLLAGSGFRAVRAAPTTYRIERAKPQSSSETRMRSPGRVVAEGPGPDIIVTAQKRSQNLATVPLSLSVVLMADAKSLPRAPTSRDISFGTEGLATTNLGPGRNRLFIRGVADSPFDGQSQSTVSVQIDHARVIFNAPDPDLRLVDVDRVEILKGPQGPLYGSGALGGIYHIVTRRPDLQNASASIRLSAQGVEHGTLGAGAEGIVNVPIIDDRLAVRASGYRFLDAGWINTLDMKKNSNSVETVGARIG